MSRESGFGHSSAGRRGHPLARLWRHARGEHRRVASATAWAITNQVLDLAPPLLIGAAVDVFTRGDESWLARLGPTEPMSQTLVLAAITLVIWVLESYTEWRAEVAWRTLAQTVQHGMRCEAYEHVQGLEMAWFEEQSSGHLLAVLNDDINQLERFLDRGAIDLVQVTTVIVVVSGVFFAMAWQVAWMAVLPVPVVVWCSVRYQRLLAPRYARVRRHAGELSHRLANNLGGMATIQSFTAEEHEAGRVAASSAAYAEANRDAILWSSAFSPLIRMVILSAFLAILVGGAWMLTNDIGGLEVATYTMMLYLTQRLLWPLTRLGQTFDLYQRAMASTQRVLDLLATAPALVDGSRRLVPADVGGELALEGVSFAYDPDAPTLRDVTLRCGARETTAIVGPTGAGKSTVVKLLQRFYDTDHGRVTIDGVDVRELGLQGLRASIAFVSQDVFLFHGTVAENIAYGSFDATREQIERAARTAEADEFIRALPRGYETIVGERGQKLSGGQRQRLSLARALLKDAPILVLDEATSAVDNETEAAIQRSLARIAHERTMVVIAHRLSTVRGADRIWVLDRGAVAEVGRHDELVEAGGVYAALWRVQTGLAVEPPQGLGAPPAAQ